MPLPETTKLRRGDIVLVRARVAVDEDGSHYISIDGIGSGYVERDKIEKVVLPHFAPGERVSAPAGAVSDAGTIVAVAGDYAWLDLGDGEPPITARRDALTLIAEAQ